MDLSFRGLTFRKKADTEQVKYINMSLQIITCVKKEKEQDTMGENRGEYLHYVRQSKKNSTEKVTFKLGPEERNQSLEWEKTFLVEGTACAKSLCSTRVEHMQSRS